MQNFRVHSVLPEPNGRIPYLTLRPVNQQCVQLSLADLDETLADVAFCLSLRNLYTLLEGKSVTINLPCAECMLNAQSQKLHLDLDVSGSSGRFSCDLELAEMALAWNLLEHATAT